MERYGEYKDSEVEWIGEIPVGWRTCRISSLYEQRNEKVSDKDYQPLSVTMKGIVPQLETAAKTQDGGNRKLVRTGDFAINSRSDRRGSCGISPLDGSVSLITNVLAPIDRSGMDDKYYGLLYQSGGFSDEYYRWGTGIVDDLWSTNWSRMKNILVPEPPVSEQSLIAAYLFEKTAEINALVTDQEKSLELLREYRKAVISEAVTKGLDPNVPMKDSGIDWIGDIPEGWSLPKLKSIATLATIRDESNKKYIGLENVESWIGTCDSIDDNAIIEGQTLKRGSGDVLFAKLRPYLAKVFVSADEGCCSSEFLVIKPSAIQSEYLKYALLSAKYIDHINAQTYGSKMPRANWEMVGGSHIPLPPKETQNYIASKLDQRIGEIDSLIAGKQQLIDKLKEYRKSLISEAVTGRFKVLGVEEG